MGDESKRYRVQLDFEPDDFHEIEAMKERLELPNRAELFHAALVALRWMEAKVKDGMVITAIDRVTETIVEPEFDFLKSTQDKVLAATRPGTKRKGLTAEPSIQ